MKLVRIACRLCGMLFAILVFMPTNVFASLTKEQAEGVAMFATTFIEKGNERRDENGYPLLVYALSNNWQVSVEIRRSGYNGDLYYIKNNNYHMKNGKYLELGPKWCMDCGDFISYVYKTTLDLDMYLEADEDPWHIKDMYADANKYDNSEYFEFIYKNVPISKIDESKLELGDVVIRMGARENHGLICVGEGMQTAHASRNAIKYSKNPPILGFEVVQLDRFYKKSTIVSIIRVKDGKVDINKKVNSTIIWPDTGEEETLLNIDNKTEENSMIEVIFPALNGKTNILNTDINILNAEILEKNKQLNKFSLVDGVQLTQKEYYEIYLNEILKLNRNPDYIEKQVFDWAIYELKRLLMQIYA